MNLNSLIVVLMGIILILVLIVFSHYYGKAMRDLESMRDQRNDWRSQSLCAAEAQRASDYSNMKEFMEAVCNLKVAIMSFEATWEVMEKRKSEFVDKKEKSRVI